MLHLLLGSHLLALLLLDATGANSNVGIGLHTKLTKNLVVDGVSFLVYFAHVHSVRYHILFHLGLHLLFLEVLHQGLYLVDVHVSIYATHHLGRTLQALHY